VHGGYDKKQDGMRGVRVFEPPALFRCDVGGASTGAMVGVVWAGWDAYNFR
jgi:hypothetical protein